MTKIAHLNPDLATAPTILAQAAELTPEAVVVCLRLDGSWCTLWTTMMPGDLALALLALHKDVIAVIE